MPLSIHGKIGPTFDQDWAESEGICSRASNVQELRLGMIFASCASHEDAYKDKGRGYEWLPHVIGLLEHLCRLNLTAILDILALQQSWISLLRCTHHQLQTKSEDPNDGSILLTIPLKGKAYQPPSTNASHQTSSATSTTQSRPSSESSASLP
jgi:hypothetical protein